MTKYAINIGINNEKKIEEVVQTLGYRNNTIKLAIISTAPKSAKQCTAYIIRKTSSGNINQCTPPGPHFNIVKNVQNKNFH